MSYFASNKIKKAAILSAFFIFLVTFDQYLKAYFSQKGSFFICNKNLSLGIGTSILFFWLTWLVLVLVLVRLYIKMGNKTYLEYFFWVFIFSGALSNAADRLTLGCVRDFIPFISANFFIFNIADFLISLGIGGLIYSLFSKK